MNVKRQIFDNILQVLKMVFKLCIVYMLMKVTKHLNFVNNKVNEYKIASDWAD